jgi:hypothetical protein
MVAERGRAELGLEPCLMARLLRFTVAPLRFRVMPMIKLEQSLTYGYKRSIGQCDVGMSLRISNDSSIAVWFSLVARELMCIRPPMS